MIGDKILPNARKTGSPPHFHRDWPTSMIPHGVPRPIGNGVTGNGIAGAIKVL
ncbi:MAG TPA: hypothetical protein VGP86_04415 [Xanthobacteraceae bacterium]|jgi:hypothetical protein|nr:hypothetical protein [Xanthobacteraceae bacterium]